VPGPSGALAALLAAVALLLVLVHALRALGAVRAAAELAALALFLYLGGATSALALTAALAVTLSVLPLAAWLWWLSPWGRSLSAALLAAGVVLGIAPTAVRAGLWPGTGAFLGAPIGAAAVALLLVFAWTLAAELGHAMDAPGLRGPAVRAAVALCGLTAAAALRWSWARMDVEAALPPAAAWAVWGLLWSAPALVALTGRAAVLPESLAGLLGSSGRALPAAALILLLGAALARAAALGDARLAAAAAGPLLPALALLPPFPPLERWRSRAFARLAAVQGFVAVLMKPRNGVPWTQEDRAFLRAGLRSLARWAPGFVLFLLPGGLALLGVYAWLLDRRRGRTAAEASATAGRRATDDAAA
jgi:hypothetical protein